MGRGDATPKVRVTRENLVALPALAPYFAFGLLAFVAVPFLVMHGAEALEAGFYRNPRVLAVLHVAALGWGASVALGALQQMTAVVGATRLYSTRLAAAAFIPFGIGVVALVSGFYSFAPAALSAAAVGVPVGVALTVWNVSATMRSAQPTRRWVLIAPYVKAAAVYVVIAFIAGAALALNLTRGTLGILWNGVFPLHIGTAAGGWFLMLVIGISYHLLTFFGLTNKAHSFRFTRTVRTLLHSSIGLGIAAAAAPALLRSRSGGVTALGVITPEAIAIGARAAAMLFLVTALGLFLWDSRGLYARPQRQRTNVVGTYVRLAHAYLAVVAVALFVATVADLFRWWGPASPFSGGSGSVGSPAAGLGTFGPFLYIVLGILIGAGWLSNTILGYLHRILAFFVWHNKYWGRGRDPGVPAFRDMVNAPLAWAGLIVYNAGVTGTVASLFIGVSSMWALIIWAVGGLLAATNLVWTLLR